jgi:hypothetical protein
MEITPIGCFLIPLAIGLSIVRPNWLYVLMIFFGPFSATSVLNFGSGEAASGLQAWMFLGALWLIRELAPQLVQLSIKLKEPLRRPSLYLSVFLLTAALSLLMPIWINGSLQIVSPSLLDFSTTPLVFRASHVFALLYLLEGSTIALLIAQRNTSEEQLTSALKIYLAAGVFVSIWGLLQLVCYAIDVSYPAIVFNGSASPGALGYAAEFSELGVKRISSVAVESTVLAQVLLTMLPLTLPAWFARGCIFSRRKDRACSLLMLLVLLLTTSSIAYIGLFTLLFTVLFLLVAKARVIKTGTILKFVFGTSAVLSILIAMAYSASEVVRTLVGTVLLDKTESYSALERLKTITFAADYFSQYPVLGVGWGSVTSHDLIFKLLSNVGMLVFIVIIFGISRGLYRRLGEEHSDESAMLTLSLLVSFVILLVTNLLTGFSYVFGHFWFIFGIAIARAYGWLPGGVGTSQYAGNDIQ